MYILLVPKVRNFFQFLLLSKRTLGEVFKAVPIIRFLDILNIDEYQPPQPGQSYYSIIQSKRSDHPRVIFVERIMSQHFWRQKYVSHAIVL